MQYVCKCAASQQRTDQNTFQYSRNLISIAHLKVELNITSSYSAVCIYLCTYTCVCICILYLI